MHITTPSLTPKRRRGRILWLSLCWLIVFGMTSCGGDDPAPKGLCDGAQPELFTSLLGGVESDVAYGLTRSADGGYALIGRTDSLSEGMNRAWVAKTDRYGKFQWGTDLGETSGRADVLAVDGGFFATHGAMKVARLDDAGAVLWEKSYDEVEDGLIEAGALAAQKGGGALVGGTRFSSNNRRSAERTAHVVRIDGEGGVVWSEKYTKLAQTHLTDIVTDGPQALLVGWTASKVGTPGREMWAAQINSTGGVNWSMTYGGLNDDEARAGAVTKDGGYLLAGMTRSYGAGDIDMWLVRVDGQGKELWNKTHGSDDSDEAYGVASVGDGFIMTGRRNSLGLGPGGLWLLEVDGEGEAVWQMTYGAAWKSAGHAILNVDDGFVVGGTTRRKSKGSDDYWLLRSDLEGRHKCVGASCFGDDDLSCGIGLSCDASTEPFQCVKAP